MKDPTRANNGFPPHPAKTVPSGDSGLKWATSTLGKSDADKSVRATQSYPYHNEPNQART